MKKKHINTLGFMATVLVIGIPLISTAQTASPSTLNTLRAEVENRVQNVKVNQEIRKNIVEERKNIASTSREAVKEVRVEARENIRAASTSAVRKDLRQEMRKDIFIIQQQRIVKQLELSIQNLKQVRDRIDSRIKKEQANGKDMSQAVKMLTIADTKILAARTALQAFKDYIPATITPSTSAITSTSTQAINIETARQMVTAVQKSIKEAHKSLTDIVVAIARAMGQKLGNIKASTSTPTSNATSSIED